jgi:5-formyltetrahydrofolate cyclo-ligase
MNSVDKALLRKEILSKRDAIPSVVKKIKDREIANRLSSLPEFKSAATVCFFASFRSEVDTFGLINKTLDEGRRVLLPKVEAGDLGLYEVRSAEELVAGYMGIPEPSVIDEDRRASVNDADAIIIPGAAYDAAGNRIGYGGGYYDRLLAAGEGHAAVIAPAYEEQIVAAVPAEPHDRRVDIIVTDRREIRCG